jgi:hypothetical protein
MTSYQNQCGRVLDDQAAFDEDALAEMVKVTIAKATAHDELHVVCYV